MIDIYTSNQVTKPLDDDRSFTRGSSKPASRAASEAKEPISATATTTTATEAESTRADAIAFSNRASKKVKTIEL